MVDYWGNFIKDSKKVIRDANDIIKNNYETLARNVENEARRMKERIDCLNRLKDFEANFQNSIDQTPDSNEKNKKFLEIMETIHKIVDSLQNVNTLCNPLNGEPHVNPGAHETDIADLNSNRDVLRDNINSFRQLVVDDENAQFAPQLNFLSQMDKILQGRILRTICLELQNIIDQGDSGKVKQYGSLAGSLLQQIDGLILALDWELSNSETGSQLLPSEERGDNNETLF